MLLLDARKPGFYNSIREVGEIANTAVNTVTWIATLPDWPWPAKTQFRCCQIRISLASAKHLNQWTTLKWEAKMLRETGTYTAGRESLARGVLRHLLRSGGGARNPDRHVIGALTPQSGTEVGGIPESTSNSLQAQQVPQGEAPHACGSAHHSTLTACRATPSTFHSLRGDWWHPWDNIFYLTSTSVLSKMYWEKKIYLRHIIFKGISEVWGSFEMNLLSKFACSTMAIGYFTSKAWGMLKHLKRAKNRTQYS